MSRVLCVCQVNDVILMGTIITLSTDWGEALEKHRLRGKGKGKVLRVIDPQDGFVERWVLVFRVCTPLHCRLNRDQEMLRLFTALRRLPKTNSLTLAPPSSLYVVLCVGQYSSIHFLLRRFCCCH